MIALCAYVIFLCLSGCDDKPTVIDPEKPTVRVVPDSEYCHTIYSPPLVTAVGVKGKYWTNGQTIRIGFIGGNASQRKYVTDGIIEIAKYVNLNFTYPAAGPYDIRYAFVSGNGSYSYVGTDCKSIPQATPTTNIGWSGLSVVLHETLHALGMAHEQASPNSDIIWNKEVVYAALGGPPNNWSRATVDWNVFRKMTQAEADATIFDPLSIGQYSVPGSWTQNYPNGIPGGQVLSAYDKLFWSKIYPKTIQPPTGVTITTAQRDSLLKWTAETKNSAASTYGKATSNETKIKQIFSQ